MWTLTDDLSSKSWDDLVAAHGGRPLQTALWADARAKAEGMQSERLLLRHNGQPVLLARVEARRHKLAGKIAWLPQGPLYLDALLAYDANVELKTALKERGYQLCFENPYDAEPPRYREHGVQIGSPAQTSIVDLSVGEEAAWTSLSAKWRNNIRSAERDGVCVTESNDAILIKQFVAACEWLSVAKGFRYRGSEELISALLLGSATSNVFAKLYCATLAGRAQGGVLVIIVGRTMQLMFSAAVRGESSPSRLLQWTAMKTAINAQVTRYDLGGMDAVTNPGVYEFKRQLRGQLVTVPPIRGSALSLRGRIALITGRAMGRV
jgi:hypothetical protein